MRSPAEGYIFVTNLSLVEYKTPYFQKSFVARNAEKSSIPNTGQFWKKKLLLSIH